MKTPAVAMMLSEVRGTKCLPSAFLFDATCNADGSWHIYRGYDPAPNSAQFSLPPIPFPLKAGDSVSIMDSVLPIAVDGKGPRLRNEAAPHTGHFLGLILGKAPGEKGKRRWALIQSADESKQIVLAAFSTRCLARAPMLQALSNEAAVSDANVAFQRLILRGVKAMSGTKALVQDPSAHEARKLRSSSTTTDGGKNEPRPIGETRPGVTTDGGKDSGSKEVLPISLKGMGAAKLLKVTTPVLKRTASALMNEKPSKCKFFAELSDDHPRREWATALHKAVKGREPEFSPRPKSKKAAQSDDSEPDEADEPDERDGELRPVGGPRRNVEPRRDGELRPDGGGPRRDVEPRDGELRADGGPRRDVEPRRDGELRPDGGPHRDVEPRRDGELRPDGGSRCDVEPRREGEPDCDDSRRDDSRRDDFRRDDFRREDDRRDDSRREDDRRDDSRRDDSRRDDFRREDYRRDDFRREDYRRDDSRREDYRRDVYRREDDSREDYRCEDDRREDYRREDYRGRDVYRREDDRREDYRREDYRRDVDRRDVYRREDDRREDYRREDYRGRDVYRREDDRCDRDDCRNSDDRSIARMKKDHYIITQELYEVTDEETRRRLKRERAGIEFELKERNVTV